MDATTVAGLATSLSSATTIVKTVLGMKVDAEVKSAIIDLQNSLISAQGAALASMAEREELMVRIKELEAQIKSSDDWSAVANHFKTDEFSGGKFVYRSDEREGLFCPKCFENHSISRLQEGRGGNGRHVAECLQCDTKLVLSAGRTPTPPQRGHFW